MESQRPHRSGSSGSELFICFTSRPSSSSASSMKISKSILSPARTDVLREPTLSSSLSRRLKSNGSMKGGQASPMFPTGNKKRGSTFENPEPSSPKVTCIGQVRVKTKKQGKKMRTRSKRRGEASFRITEQTQEGIQQQYHHHQECLPHRNQKWVHIPLTICEALRTFGAEFNCFLPCRSSCSSANEREKEEKTRTNTTSSSSCGAVFARWLMAIEEGEEENRTEMGLMVGVEKSDGRPEAVDVEVIEIDEKREVKEEIEDEEEERVSICIPPRNALLLMRCRSEPFRMSSLANRFWDSPGTKDDDHGAADDDDDEDSEEEEDEEEEEDVDDDEVQACEAQEEGEDNHDEGDEEVEENFEEVKVELDENQGEEEMATVALGEIRNPEENEEYSEIQGTEVEKDEENPERGEEGYSVKQVLHDKLQVEHKEGQNMENGSSAEALEEVEKPENKVPAAERETSSPVRIEEEAAVAEGEGGRASSSSSSSSAASVQATEPDREGGEPEQEAAETALEEREEETKEEKTDDGAQEAEETKTEETPEETRETELPQNQQQQQQNRTHEDQKAQNKDGQGEGAEEKSEQREEKSNLPDCLLLMLCEPKLSMEVSKETWVCSTDFIRCRPERPPLITDDGGDESKNRVSTDSNPAQQQQLQHQPPQQQHHQQQAAQMSALNPAPLPAVLAPPPSMAAMIEQKFVNAKAYEPFVLTRCKSEPVRSSAKLAPEACFWKNRRLEPHRPTTLGVGGAGFGC